MRLVCILLYPPYLINEESLGIYISSSDCMKCRHWWSCCFGSCKIVCPIKAMSLLKSLYNIIWLVWYLVIYCVIVCNMIGMSCMSSWCEGMYRCRMKIGISGELLISIICKYRDISRVVGIFVMLFGWVYLLLIIVNNPLHGETYDTLVCLVYLVFVCVLLNRNLYCENILYEYLGNFFLNKFGFL